MEFVLFREPPKVWFIISLRVYLDGFPHVHHDLLTSKLLIAVCNVYAYETIKINILSLSLKMLLMKMRMQEMRKTKQDFEVRHT